MEIPAYVNVPDFVKIGLMAFAFIWGANKALTALNLNDYKVA